LPIMMDVSKTSLRILGIAEE